MVKVYTNQSGSKPYPLRWYIPVWLLQGSSPKAIIWIFETRYGDQFTLSTQLMKPNYLLILRDRRSTTVSLETYYLYSIKVGMASQYITAYTIHQRCSHSSWVDNRENLHSYWLSSLLLLAWVSLLHVTHSLRELLDLRKLFSLLTWRTVVQQLVSGPKSGIIQVCIIGHKHHPQAFVQWIKLYRNKPWCTT